MKFDRQRAARIIVDAAESGDETAAARWKISEKTVRRYRVRLLEDPELSNLVRGKARAADASWHIGRARFLAAALRKLETMIEQAKPEDINAVSQAIERVGNLDIASGVLRVGHPDDSTDSPAPEAPRQHPPAPASLPH